MRASGRARHDRRWRGRFLAACCCVLLPAIGAHAGNTSELQDLINAAPPGGTVYLPAGTFTGGTLSISRSVYLVGAEDADGAPATIIDGEGTGILVTVYAYLEEQQWADDGGEHSIAFANIVFLGGNNYTPVDAGPMTTDKGGAVSIRTVGSCQSVNADPEELFVQFANCHIESCWANGQGGGIGNIDFSTGAGCGAAQTQHAVRVHLNVFASQFADNGSGNGGADIDVTQAGLVYLSQTTFEPTRYGGSVHIFKGLNLITWIKDVRLLGSQDAAITQYGGMLYVGNSIITGHKRAILTSNNCELRVFHTTIAHNTREDDEPAGVLMGAWGGPTTMAIRNSILWGNRNINGSDSDAQYAHGHPSGIVELAWSTIQGEFGAQNPLFTDSLGADGLPGGADADYRLLPGSPGIDNTDSSQTFWGWSWPETNIPSVYFQCRDGIDGVYNAYDGPLIVGGAGLPWEDVWCDQGPLPCNVSNTSDPQDIVWSGWSSSDAWSSTDNWYWSNHAPTSGDSAIFGPVESGNPIIDGWVDIKRLYITKFTCQPEFQGQLYLTDPDRSLRVGGFSNDLGGPSSRPQLVISGPYGFVESMGGGDIGLGGTVEVQSPSRLVLGAPLRLLDGGRFIVDAGAEVMGQGSGEVIVAAHGGELFARGAANLNAGDLELSGTLGEATRVTGELVLDVTNGDSLHVTGDVELGGTIVLNIPEEASMPAGSFTILSCTGTMSGPAVISAPVVNNKFIRVTRSQSLGGSTLTGTAVDVSGYLALAQSADASTSSDVNDALLADVDNDGGGAGGANLPDLLITAGGSENSLHVLLNGGDTNGDDVWDGFATQMTMNFGATAEPMGIAVGNTSGADVSDTDLPEIAVADRTDMMLRVLTMVKSGGVVSMPDPSAVTTIDVPCFDGTDATDGDCDGLPMPDPIDVMFWDIDEDGDLDLLATSYGDSSYRMWETTSTLSAMALGAEVRPARAAPAPPWSVDPADDEKAKDDAQTAGATNPGSIGNGVTVLNRGGDGDVWDLDLIEAPLSGASGGNERDLTMAVGDLDGNTYEDMVIAQQAAGTVEIVLMDADGPYGASSIASPGLNPQSIALGDFDDDGDLDIAVIVEGTTGALETRMLRNDTVSGSGIVTFVDTGEVIDSDGEPIMVLAGDVDNVDGTSGADDAVILSLPAGLLSGSATLVEPSVDGPIQVSTVAALQEAVANAGSGTAIQIAAGTYQLTAPLDFQNKDLSITGVPSLRGESLTELIAPAGDRVFRLDGGQSEATRLENLIIEGNDLGGGLLVKETTGDGPVIEDCTIQNCTFGYGAAIYLGSSDATKEHKLTVRRCSFGLNEADSHSNDGVPQGDGGGIYAYNANLTVDDCAFVANSAADDGGAILSRSSVVTLTESIFQMNNTPSSGGAIYTFGTGNMTAENCTFGANDGQPMGGQLSNTCGVDGGAIYATSTGNSLLLIGCDFRDNDAARRGGAVIARDGASFEAYNSLFEANTTSGYGTTEVRGGAIYAYNCDLFNLNNCDFFDNESQVGGAVRQGGSDPTDATITDCEFRGNKATMSLNGGVSFGGAMDLYQSTPCILTRCTIVDNEAGDYGGGLRVASNTPVTLSDSIVCSNSPDQIFGTTTNVDGTWIADTCDLDGDGIPDNEDSWPYGPNPEIAGSLQQAVDNATNGDVISLATGTYISSAGAAAVVDTAGKEITIVGQLGSDGVPTSIIDGEGVRDGLLVENGSSGTSIFQNLLIQHGAFGAYVSQSSALFDHCWFIDNTTTTSGAALYVMDCHEDDDHSVTIESCRFENNTALTGAGLYAADSTITIEDTDFEANESTASNGAGGAAYVIRSNASFASCLFTGNQTDGKGGALFLGYDLDSQPCIMTDCDFFSNYARAGGGAIRVYSANATLTGCRFGLEGSPSTGNTTSTPSYAGGAVEAYQGSLAVSDCDFHHNLSHYGGGLFVDNCHESQGLPVTLQSCRFTNNDAASGGGFYGYDSTITIQDTDFDANESTASNGAGGAIYVRSVASDALLVDLTMTGCTFTRNSAENTGGALWTDVADVTMESCIFGDPDDATAGNSTPHGWGGAVRLFNVAGSSNPFSTICSATIRGGGFYDNHANVRGGAIYYKGMPLTIESADDGSPCVFRGNTTGAGTSDTAEDDRGGAISIDDGSFAAEHDDGDGPILSVTGAIFENNSTEDQWGGALYLHDVETEFTDCTFTGNNATIGGAIRCYRKTTTLTNCSFTGNIARVDINGNGSGYGGAISSDDSAVVASGCSFESNEAEYWGGGGVHLAGADQLFDNCAFTNNTAAHPDADTWSEGGAMYCFSQADDGPMTQLTLTSCSFTGNEGGNGGAVRNLKGSVLVSGGSYVDNAARGPNADGGALNMSDTSITVTSQFSACILSGNTADDQAGAVALVNCSPSIGGAVFTGVELIGNTADEGGAVLIYGDTMATFTYCVLTENQSPVQGSAIMISEDLFSGELELAGTTICNNGPNPGGGVYAEPISGAWTDLGGNAIAEVCDGDGDGVFSGCDPDESEGDDCNEDGVIDTCQPGMEDDFTGGPASTLDWVVHDEPGANVLGPSSWSFSSDAVVQASNIWGYPDQYGWQPGTFLECRGTPTLNRNFTIAAALLNYDNDATGIAFCMQDPDTCYVFESIAEQGMSRLWLRESGVSTVLWQGAASIPTGSWCWVVVDVQGDAISVTVDGVVITSVTNTAMSGGTMAFWCRGNQGGWYDTLRISVPEPTDSDGDGIADCNDTYPGGPDPGVPGSLQTAVDNAVDGDVITLAAGLYELTDSLDFGTRNLSLIGAVDQDGASTTTLLATNSQRAIILDGGQDSSTRLENLIIDGNSTGGCLFVSDSPAGNGPVAQNVIFRNGFSSANAGAVLVYTDGHFTCISSRFENNTALHGGAVLVTNDGQFHASDCEFVGNTASSYGGAIISQATCVVMLEGCDFTANTASHGGAIFLDSHTDLTATTCTFDLNSSSNLGSAIYARWNDTAENHSPIIVLEDCGFTRNTSGSGGTIYARQTTMTATKCVFGSPVDPSLANSAFSYGGAIRLHNGWASGSGDQAMDPDMVVTLLGCEFYDQHAGFKGGAIYNKNTRLIIGDAPDGTPCRFQNNTTGAGTPEVMETDRGGAIYVIHAGFHDDHPLGSGPILSVSGAIFENNSTEDQWGGALYLQDIDTEFIDCTFTGNNATIGGAIRCYRRTTTLTNCDFTGNIARVEADGEGSGFGGAISSDESSIQATNCLFDSNSAQYYGGGSIYLTEADHSLLGCTFTNNQALTVLGSTAYVGGGAIYCSGNHSDGVSRTLSLDDCSFDGNQAWYGGAVRNLSGKINISGSSFANNAAIGDNGDGGAIDLHSCEVRVADSTFDGNTADHLGGAISLQYDCTEAAGLPAMENLQLLNNTADRGGAVFIYDGSVASMHGCTVTGNTSTDGETIWNHGTSPGVLSIGSSTICDNGTMDDVSTDPISGDWTDLGGNCISINCDSDADGTYDCDDGCPDDPNKTEPGQCGCGTPDTDSDGDGIADCNDTYPGGPNPGVPGSLQQAVDNADDGETIQLAAGSYTGVGDSVVSIAGKSITIAGAVGLRGEPSTTIDGEDSRPCVQVDGTGGYTAALQDLLLTNGYSLSGGGLDAVLADLSLVRCVISGNTAEASGGGLSLVESTVSMLECTVGSPDNPAEGNVAITQHGGGLYVFRSSLVMDNCVVGQNIASRTDGSAYGGGIFAMDCLAASGHGLTMSETVITSNGGRNGAGMFLEGVSLVTNAVSVSGNTIINSEGAGGGIYAKSLGGNGASSDLTLDTCSLLGNQAVNGGGLYLAVGSAAEFIGGQCSGNGADAGGGMIVDDSTVTLDGVDVIGNTSTGGAAVVTLDTGSLAVSNTTICGNGPDPGNGAYGDPISGNVTDLGGNCISIDCDSDSDGTYDCDDGCPDDPDKTEPGECGCGVADDDSDGDGTADCIDGCPDDPLKTEPGDCGCGVPDEDADGNGISDCLESDCPGDADGTGFVNIEDLLVVLGEYGPCPEGCAADFDQDGDVDIDDMLTVIGNWGPCG